MSVVKVLHKWRKPIVYGTVAVAVLSAIISLVVPVYYESTTIFYAASEDLFKPKKVFGYGDSEIEYYGNTDDIQRILTVANSIEVTDYLVDKFDLYEAYNLDPDRSKAAFLVRIKLLNHYSVVRTKYDAIELTVEDRDPRRAADMANSAREKINSIITGMIKGSQDKVIDSYEKAIEQKELALTTIRDSLRDAQLRYGIFDPEAQTEYLSTLITSTETKLINERAKLGSYERASGAGVRDSINKITANIAGLESMIGLLQGTDTTMAASNYNIERFNMAKGQIGILTDEYRKAMNYLNNDKELLKTLESAHGLDVPAMHILEVAQVPVVKSRPRRTLLVLLSTITAFVFIVIGVLFIESYKHLDWSFLKEW